jgi:hypothetical protein
MQNVYGFVEESANGIGVRFAAVGWTVKTGELLKQVEVGLGSVFSGEEKDFRCPDSRWIRSLVWG